MTLSLKDFEKDSPWGSSAEDSPVQKPTQIEGLTVQPLINRSDDRGFLTELLTTRDSDILPIVHVYQVHCAPGSIRGWVYHEHQEDRLAYTEGHMTLVLYDLREDSPTHGKLVRLEVGADNPCVVTIPRFVAHLLRNSGDTMTSFVNMPTAAYDPANPDKARLPYPDARIPFTFDG